TQKSFGIQEAYHTAEVNNPSLKQVRESVNQVQTNIGLARSFLLPNVNGSARGDRRKDANSSRGSDDYNLFHTEVTLNQPLFVVGSLSAVSSAKQDTQITQLGVDIASRNLGVTVIQNYFQVALNGRNVDTLVRQQKIVTDSLKVTEHRYHTGRSQLLD